MSEVAATNPYAWFPQARTVDELTTPTPNNRLVGYPYTKYEVSVMDVDMAATVIVASHAKADELGVPLDRRVYLRGWCYATDPVVRGRAHGPVGVAGDGRRRARKRSAAPARRSTTSRTSTCTRASPSRCTSPATPSASPADDPRGLTVTGGLPVRRRRGQQLHAALDRDDGRRAACRPRIARPRQRRRHAHDQARVRRCTRRPRPTAPSSCPTARRSRHRSTPPAIVPITDTLRRSGQRRELHRRPRPRRRGRVGPRHRRRR